MSNLTDLNKLAAATAVAQRTWVVAEAALRWQTACEHCEAPRALPNPMCPTHPTT